MMIHYQAKFGCNRIISSEKKKKKKEKKRVKIVIVWSLQAPHCDLHLEDNHFLHDIPAHDDASLYQVWLQRVKWFRGYLHGRTQTRTQTVIQIYKVEWCFFLGGGELKQLAIQRGKGNPVTVQARTTWHINHDNVMQHGMWTSTASQRCDLSSAGWS